MQGISQPSTPWNEKANMDNAKAARDAALKKFQTSYKRWGGTAFPPRKTSSASAQSDGTIAYSFPSSEGDIYSNYGIAWGFDDKKFNGRGYYSTTTSPGIAKRKNSTNAKGSTFGGTVRFGIPQNQWYKDFIAYEKAEARYLAAKGVYDKGVKKNTPSPPPPPGGDKKRDPKAPPATPTTYAYGDTTLKYNLGAVNDMYFSPSSTAGGMRVAGGNQPVKRVRNAQELWTDKSFTDDGKSLVDNGYKSAYKGMIQSYSVSAAKTTTGGTASEAEKNKTLNPYKMGFQFHYNPSRIGTTWAGVLNVDPGFISSGKDKFGPVGAQSGTGSGVTITIPLNRLSDMKYVNTSESKWSEMPWRELYGVSIKEQPDGKESQSPTFEDLRKIRDLGTMYDVEFLLQTIVGYRQKSYIRQNRHALTADLGYLGGLPVELHLGKNMRYFVTITSISVNHSIFTKDMIPTLSELTVTCSRLPDYITK
jgi:hypothetical protein